MRSPLLLVGQAPGPSGGGDPLNGRVGRRVAGFANLAVGDYLERTERVNVLPHFPGKAGKGDRFPLKEARKRAAVMTPRLRDRRVVLVGKGVARAFGVEGLAPFTWHAGVLGAETLAWAQHPSGINRWYNEPENRRRAERFFRRALQNRNGERGT